MNVLEDPFVALAVDDASSDFAELERRPTTMDDANEAHRPAVSGPAVGRLVGFDLLERPLIGSLSAAPGQVLAARTATPLRRAMIGREVVVWFESGDLHSPIIMGVMEPHALAETPVKPGVSVVVDGERHVIEAEREIVLRCGDASITLTRAGKVIIKGNYILSRSTGYNKIKGAAIDIN
jgi:hypothetical protein